MNPARPTSRAGRWRRALGITAIGALAFTVVAPAAHAAAEGLGDARAGHLNITPLRDDPYEIFGDDPHEIFGDDPHEIFSVPESESVR